MTGLLKAPKVRKHLVNRLQALARMFPALRKWAISPGKRKDLLGLRIEECTSLVKHALGCSAIAADQRNSCR